jgi:hypothetical protein
MMRLLGTLAVLATLAAAPGQAAVLTESFDNPLGGWHSRWFGQNTNATNFLYDPNDRGNNVTGLTIFDGDPYDGGIPKIFFDAPFAAQITNFSFDILSYNQQTLVVFDKDGNTLLSQVLTPVAGPPFDFADANYTRYSVDSTNGIGGFTLLPFGAEGNVSIDDLSVTITEVPEPASAGLLLAGILGLGAATRRRILSA